MAHRHSSDLILHTPAALSLTGRMDAHACDRHWHRGRSLLGELAPGTRLPLDLSGISYLDTAGALLIQHLHHQARDLDLTLQPRGLAPEFTAILDQVNTTPELPPEPGTDMGWVEKTGQSLVLLGRDCADFIHFTGEMTWIAVTSLMPPGRIRWKETLTVAEKAGVNALPIVMLISFIVGLVMAFQAAVPMKMFGAELYVANLIGVAMVRELGPLMTAIVLAGRSASAFAAEIGTMKINEELDALTVMGLDPMRFLILPRILASTLVTPLLTVFANLVGIMGGAVVIRSFGYPLVAYYNQVVGFVTWMDFAGGLVKCFVFGILIAATGCLRGYHTGRGPAAVGAATTSAVVSCIILIAVFDGIFSIIYYYLGI